MEGKMFYGASPELFCKAKRLRENMTLAEMKLWEHLKENKLKFRFKTQHPIDIFIADFYCHELKIIIEIDGKIHDNPMEFDEARSNELEYYEIKVIRFTNEEVINNIASVILKLKEFINEIQLLKSESE